jgi:hypothetical protein
MAEAAGIEPLFYVYTNPMMANDFPLVSASNVDQELLLVSNVLNADDAPGET